MERAPPQNDVAAKGVLLALSIASGRGEYRGPLLEGAGARAP